jgi:hypothetical protein
MTRSVLEGGKWSLKNKLSIADVSSYLFFFSESGKMVKFHPNKEAPMPFVSIGAF